MSVVCTATGLGDNRKTCDNAGGSPELDQYANKYGTFEAERVATGLLQKPFSGFRWN